MSSQQNPTKPAKVLHCCQAQSQCRAMTTQCAMYWLTSSREVYLAFSCWSACVQAAACACPCALPHPYAALSSASSIVLTSVRRATRRTPHDEGDERHALFGNAATMHTMPQSGRRGWRAVHTSRRRICFPWRSNAPSLPRQTHEHTTVDRCPGITRHLRPRIIRKRTGEVSAPSVRSFPTPQGSAWWTRTSRI